MSVLQRDTSALQRTPAVRRPCRYAFCHTQAHCRALPAHCLDLCPKHKRTINFTGNLCLSVTSCARSFVRSSVRLHIRLLKQTISSCSCRFNKPTLSGNYVAATKRRPSTQLPKLGDDGLVSVYPLLPGNTGAGWLMLCICLFQLCQSVGPIFFFGEYTTFIAPPQYVFCVALVIYGLYSGINCYDCCCGSCVNALKFILSVSVLARSRFALGLFNISTQALSTTSYNPIHISLSLRICDSPFFSVFFFTKSFFVLLFGFISHLSASQLRFALRSSVSIQHSLL